MRAGVQGLLNNEETSFGQGRGGAQGARELSRELFSSRVFFCPPPPPHTHPHRHTHLRNPLFFSTRPCSLPCRGTLFCPSKKRKNRFSAPRRAFARQRDSVKCARATSPSNSRPPSPPPPLPPLNKTNALVSNNHVTLKQIGRARALLVSTTLALALLPPPPRSRLASAQFALMREARL